MDYFHPALSAILQLYCWGFFISLAFFLIIMVMRGVGNEGYGEHVAACIGLALTWPYTGYEIMARFYYG